jgi:signal transduction histidine kinase
MSQPATSCGERNARLEEGGKESIGDNGNTSLILDRLNERLRFETFLARLSATFIHLPATEIDSQIERGLQQIVEFLDIERSSFGEFLEDRGEFLTTHSYVVPGFPPFVPIIADRDLPWYVQELRRRKVFRIRRIPDDFPPEAVREREFCLRIGLKSNLTLLLEVGGAIVGGLAFGSFRRYMSWPDDLVQTLQLVGEIFANAVARKRAEEHSRTLRDQLFRVSRVSMMGELAASIAHEVNQPLCAIVSNAQTLRRLLAGTSMDVEEALDDIIRDGQRASAVIGRVRGFFQKTPPERVALNVNDIIHEVAALLRFDLARRGIILKLALEEELPPVLGDRIQLQQVVVNLLSNGADAMEGIARESRELAIRSTTEESGAVSIFVKDAGIGIDPGNREHLFEAFFTTKPGSMGMGLAICKSIVEAHRGRIEARSNGDRGTTFSFTLPGLSPALPAAKAAEAGANEEAGQ